MITDLTDDDIRRTYAAIANPNIVPALRRYVTDGIPVGGFLTAILENDLAGAITRADSSWTVRGLLDLYWLIQDHLPLTSHGSRTRVEGWLMRHEQQAREAREGARHG